MGLRAWGLPLLAAALGCAPRCGCDGLPGAGQRPVDPRDFGDAVIADPLWTIAVEDGGALRVHFNDVDVVTGVLQLGGTAGAEIALTHAPIVVDGMRTRFATTAQALRLRVLGESQPEGSGMVVDYTLEADADLDDLVGGGMVFTLRSDARIFGAQAPAPTLLDGDRGFAWDTGRGTVRFEFDPPLAAVHYAAVSDTVRCGFYHHDVRAGTHAVRLRVTLPDGGAVRPSAFADMATAAPDWHDDTMPWNDVPIDVSFLNADDRPAGRHGPVRIEGDAILRGDGSPLRLWGTNVVAYALFSVDDDAIVAQAKRLAAAGFNLVRIHHHDSAWVEPNVFGLRAPGTRTLDDGALGRIDRWVAALQAEGIYVWLDLHVGRTFTRADDIEAFAELEGGRGHGLNFVNTSIAARMREFARAYLDRTNRYTQRRYADDPGILGVLVTNENDIVHHFGGLMAQEAGRPTHHGWLDARAQAFATRTGLEVPSPIEPWLVGPTKMALADIEAEFFGDAIADLRRMGYRGPIASTQLWGDESMYALPSLTTGDLIDVHAYDGEGVLTRNPHVDATLVHGMGTAALAGFPTTISEWNIPAPNRDRFVGPMFVAATAALQRWDAVMFYAYTAMPIAAPVGLDPWSSWDDPAIMAMMPAAALMFRRDVAPARERYVVVLDRDAVFGARNNVLTVASTRTLVERSEVRVVLPTIPELPWLRGTEVPAGATVLDELDHDHLPPGSHEVESDTGELRRDWRSGVHTVVTARSIGASGSLGGRALAVGDATIAMTTPRAAVALSSLDGLPLVDSAAILLSCTAQVVASDGMKRPLRSEPVRGVITLRSAHARLRWQPLGVAAPGVAAQTTAAQGGVHRFVLGGEPVHFWRATPVEGDR